MDNLLLAHCTASARLVTSTDRPPRTAEVTVVDIEKAASKTRDLMCDDSGVDTIIQPTFLHGDFVARGDVVRRRDDGTWEIIEIKSSLDKSHRKKVPDLAFTTYVAEESAARPISASTLVSVNSSYVSPGPLSLHSHQVRVGTNAARASAARYQRCAY